MGRVTIYLDEQTERDARAAARAEGVSLSRWITGCIVRPARGEWPASIRALAGAWRDQPATEEIPKSRTNDVPRRRR